MPFEDGIVLLSTEPWRSWSSRGRLCRRSVSFRLDSIVLKSRVAPSKKDTNKVGFLLEGLPLIWLLEWKAIDD